MSAHPNDTKRAAAREAASYLIKLSITDRAVLIAIINHCSVENMRPSVGEEALAGLLGISDRAVRYAKAKVRKAGYLSWVTRSVLHEIDFDAIIADGQSH